MFSRCINNTEWAIKKDRSSFIGMGARWMSLAMNDESGTFGRMRNKRLDAIIYLV